jgi:hypothetical protein
MIQLRNGLPASVEVKHVAQIVDEAWNSTDDRSVKA